jgi:hypothetical protein
MLAESKGNGANVGPSVDINAGALKSKMLLMICILGSVDSDGNMDGLLDFEGNMDGCSDFKGNIDGLSDFKGSMDGRSDFEGNIDGYSDPTVDGSSLGGEDNGMVTMTTHTKFLSIFIHFNTLFD